MSNIKLRSLKLSIKNDAQNQMVESGFGRRFYHLNYLEFGIFFIPCVHYLPKGVITKIYNKPLILCNSIIF